MIFPRLSQNTQKVKESLRLGPRTDPNVHNHALSLRLSPWKDLGARNWVSGEGGGGRRRNPARPAAGLAGEDV
jgi:hypothetical protein